MGEIILHFCKLEFIFIIRYKYTMVIVIFNTALFNMQKHPHSNILFHICKDEVPNFK